LETSQETGKEGKNHLLHTRKERLALKREVGISGIGKRSQEGTLQSIGRKRDIFLENPCSLGEKGKLQRGERRIR